MLDRIHGKTNNKKHKHTKSCKNHRLCRQVMKQERSKFGLKVNMIFYLLPSPAMKSRTSDLFIKKKGEKNWERKAYRFGFAFYKKHAGIHVISLTWIWKTITKFPSVSFVYLGPFAPLESSDPAINLQAKTWWSAGTGFPVILTCANKSSHVKHSGSFCFMWAIKNTHKKHLLPG